MVSVNAIAEKNNVDETVMGAPINDINHLFNANDNFRAAGSKKTIFTRLET
jgi:hypothetical protein